MKELRNIVLRSRCTGEIFICTPEFKFSKVWDNSTLSWEPTCIPIAFLKGMQRIGQNYGAL